MKIIVAHSGDSRSQPLKAYVRALQSTLAEAGHQVEELKIPRPDEGGVSAAIASHRRTMLDPWCDALICLDAFSAVLKHRRKLLWMLTDDFLAPTERTVAERFSENVIRAACREAGVCFAPSPFAVRVLAKWGLENTALLAPTVGLEQHAATRTAGAELLVVEPLRSTSRVRLFLDCIATLPEPFRGRWSAPWEDPEASYSAQRQAKVLGLASRVSFDMRPVDDAELVHFVASSVALLICESDAMAVAPQVASARRLGVPVVVCNDSGAAAAGRKSGPGYQIVPPDAAAIAAAITDSDATLPAARRGGQSPRAQRSGWAPLIEELGA